MQRHLCNRGEALAEVAAAKAAVHRGPGLRLVQQLPRRPAAKRMPGKVVGLDKPVSQGQKGRELERQRKPAFGGLEL